MDGKLNICVYLRASEVNLPSCSSCKSRQKEKLRQDDSFDGIMLFILCGAEGAIILAASSVCWRRGADFQGGERRG